jgi:hypothetical protein
LDACFEVAGDLAGDLGDEREIGVGLPPLRVFLDHLGEALGVGLLEVLRGDARVVGAVFEADSGDPETVARLKSANHYIGHEPRL